MSDDDLRTALSKLAENYETRADLRDHIAADLRAVLAAHPAPEVDEPSDSVASWGVVSRALTDWKDAT